VAIGTVANEAGVGSKIIEQSADRAATDKPGRVQPAMRADRCIALERSIDEIDDVMASGYG
jgi:hypothetical protein